jgi:RNA polymerase sigma factor (sigma-70 family)
MEDEILYKEYIIWRKSGVHSQKIEKLIHLHLYFRHIERINLNNKYSLLLNDEKEEGEEEKLETSPIEEVDFSLFSFEDGMSDSIKYEYDDSISEVRNNENDLIIGLARGESSAFKELYENEFHKIKDYITSNSGSKIDAQDIFQDGVVVLLEKVKTPGFEFTCKVGTYLYSCCRNIWLKQLRKSKKELSSEYYEIYDVVDVSLIEEPEYHEEKLEKILATVSESCLKLFQAFYYKNKSWEIIASEFGYSSINSAKNQKYKCLQKISSN